MRMCGTPFGFGHRPSIMTPGTGSQPYLLALCCLPLPFFDPQVEPTVSHSHSQNITPVTKSEILGIVRRACIAGVVVGRSQEMRDDGGSKSKPRLSRSR